MKSVIRNCRTCELALVESPPPQLRPGFGLAHPFQGDGTESSESRRPRGDAVGDAGEQVFVLLTKVDRNPLVILEALAAGLPIVSSDKAGNAVDFIEEGQNGFVVDPGDSQVVCDRILQILAWDDLKRARSRAVSLDSVRKANYQDAARAFLEACRAARDRMSALEHGTQKGPSLRHG